MAEIPTYASVAALPSRIRSAVAALREAEADQADIKTMVDEIHRLRDQAGALMVDRDRQVQKASERALSCEAHGNLIRELEAQVGHFSRAAERHDRARLVLLGMVHDLVHDLDRIPADAKVSVEDLRKAARKTLDAHRRAWK